MVRAYEKYTTEKLARLRIRSLRCGDPVIFKKKKKEGGQGGQQGRGMLRANL